MLTQTPSQTVGPLFSFGLFFGGDDDLVDDPTKGKPIYITGVVSDDEGEPVQDPLVEIWQTDAQGYFNHPAPTPTTRISEYRAVKTALKLLRPMQL